MLNIQKYAEWCKDKCCAIAHVTKDWGSDVSAEVWVGNRAGTGEFQDKDKTLNNFEAERSMAHFNVLAEREPI